MTYSYDYKQRLEKLFAQKDQGRALRLLFRWVKQGVISDEFEFVRLVNDYLKGEKK